MTLNVTVASPRLLICATDRRLTNPLTGKILTEQSTKLTELYCADALALIAYNGIGSFAGKTPADWLLDLDSREHISSMRFCDVLQALRKESAVQINKVPKV